LPLLARITTTDTWPEMERAAHERYFDSVALATGSDSRPTGAAYLAGYVAEMLLKTAYYRTRGVGQLDDAAPELRGMRSRALAIGCTWSPGSRGHNLSDICDLLIKERDFRGRAFDPYFAALLRGHVITVFEHWSERLRYKDIAASEGELAELFASVSWILDNYAVLGS
jgi:hypothetical protein